MVVGRVIVGGSSGSKIGSWADKNKDNNKDKNKPTNIPGQGYSYVSNGIGYEVSPEGKTKIINYSGGGGGHSHTTTPTTTSTTPVQPLNTFTPQPTQQELLNKQSIKNSEDKVRSGLNSALSSYGTAIKLLPGALVNAYENYTFTSNNQKYNQPDKVKLNLSKGAVSSSTTYSLPLQETEVSFGTKVGDIINSALLQPQLLANTINLPSSETFTGKSLTAEYQEEQNKINPWKTGNYFGAVKNLYETQQEYRKKSNKMQDVLANQIYDINLDYGVTLTPFDTSRRNFASVGLDLRDFPITTTKTVIKEGSSYVDKEGIGWEVSPEYSISSNMNTGINFNKGSENIVRNFVSSGEKGKGYLYFGSIGTAEVAKTALFSSVGYSVGLTGGASTEGGVIGRTFSTGASLFPKLGTALEFTARPAVQWSLVGLTGASKGFEGYSFGKNTGLNPLATTAMGFSGGVSQYFVGVAGATGGEVSPYRKNSFSIVNEKGELNKVTTYSIGDPFTGKYKAVATNIAGKNYLGYAPSSAFKGYSMANVKSNELFFGTGEGESFLKHYTGKSQEFEDIRYLVKNLRMVNTKEDITIKLSEQKGFSDWSKEEQIKWENEIKNLGDINKISSYGFRHYTGSLTNPAITRQKGDVDIVLGYKANPEDIASGIASRMGEGWSSSGGQIFRGNVKVAEGLLPENAIPRPMGFFGRYTTSASIGGTQTTVTKLGQSLTELGSAISNPTINPETGEFVLGLNIDKPQRIADFYKSATMLSNIKGGNYGRRIESFKNLFAGKYPNLDFNAGVITSSSSFGSASISSFSSSSTTSSLMSLSSLSTTPSRKGGYSKSISSSNIISSITSTVPSSSSSSSSYMNILKPSRKSSHSSLSSLSSLSSSSSSSSSSISSLSSLSSRSSRSSLSSLSSLYSSSSSSSSRSSRASSLGGFSYPFFLGFGSPYSRRLSPARGRRISKTRYTPSFGSVILNIKAPRGYNTKRRFTGLELRPIVSNNIFKRKKSTKRRK